MFLLAGFACACEADDTRGAGSGIRVGHKFNNLKSYDGDLPLDPGSGPTSPPPPPDATPSHPAPGPRGRPHWQSSGHWHLLKTWPGCLRRRRRPSQLHPGRQCRACRARAQAVQVVSSVCDADTSPSRLGLGSWRPAPASMRRAARARSP
jgi:hypothetical protein